MMTKQTAERTLLTVQSDCPARLVPSGTEITIPENTFVTLTQSLGGSYTVLVNGNMARVDGLDAEALGMQPLRIDYADDGSGTLNEENLWQTLRTVYDPEIPVNLVDLGLIYECRTTPHASGGMLVHIRMTLTSLGCGMGPVLVADVKHRLLRVPHVSAVEVELVFDPPWDRKMMSEEARLELGLF